MTRFLLIPALAALLAAATTVRAGDDPYEADFARTYLSAGASAATFDAGAASVRRGAGLFFRLGRDFSEYWTLEAGADWIPKDSAHDFVQFAADAQLHLTRWDQTDFFFAAGLGFRPEAGTRHDDFAAHLGFGLLYHLGERFALRGEVRLEDELRHGRTAAAVGLGFVLAPF